MKIVSFTLLALVLLTLGCDNSEPKRFCQVNSVKNLDWLNQEIENNNYESSDIMDVSIYQALYNGNTVIITVICCPVCDLTPPAVKDCSGATLGQLGVDIAADIINKGRIIWRTHHDVCS